MKMLLLTSIAIATMALTSCNKTRTTNDHSGHEQNKKPEQSSPAETKPITVDAGCGSCTYSIDGIEDCVTYVNIDGKKLKVTGIEHDTHKSGLCKSGKHSAKVVGEVKGEQFVATSFDVISADKKEMNSDDHSGHDHGSEKHDDHSGHKH